MHFANFSKYGSSIMMMLAVMGGRTAMASGVQTNGMATVGERGIFLLIGVVLLLLARTLRRKHTRESGPDF